MYKEKRKVNRKSFDWYGLSQRFSIRKYHFGAASVLLGTALILGSPQASAKADDAVSANTALTSTGQGVDEGTNSATDGLKNVTLPTASTTEAAVLEKPTLSAEEIAKQAAASETHAITSPSETAKEESKPATSDAVVKTNTEEQSKTDKLTEKETKVEEKAEKKAEPDDSKKEETKKVSSEESTVTELNKKKEEVAPKRSKRSKRELSDGETTDYSGAKISGRLNDGKTQYAVGDQILGSYNLDISSPTKIEEGGYILITASDNEPLDTFEIGSSLRYEKVNNNQYKLYTGELSGGAYANINVSYKLKKFETGKDSNTTIKAELFDKNNTLIKSTNFSNTNTTGTPYVSVDTRNGIRRQTLLETNQPETEIDVSKSKDLQLNLKSTNKEAAAITKIDHAVELPAGVTIAQTSLDAGWRLENGVAKYTRVVPSSTTMFASGENTQDELLYLNVSNGGTPAEFLTGKKLTFKDNATYTDKSGFTNTTSDDVTVTVRAVNPKESIGGSGENNSGTGGSTVPTKSDVQVAIFNDTMEKNNSRVVNIAMPYINTKTEDTRRINLSGNYGDSHGPASVKEVEISIDSNIDQNRAIEFYAIWTPTDKGKSTFVSYEDNPESLGLNSTLTFEVYSVTNGTESKIGEVSLRKGDVADKVALPDGATTVKLKPKGNMPLETAGLQAVGLFLSQDLKGLEAAKELAKEGNKVESIVTASVYTHGYEEPKVAVSKTTFANSRDAIKLVPATNPINTTLAGNLTQELSSQYEVYEYSPNGLGNRIYNKQTWDRKTFVDLQEISAKNAKLLVELPDGFSYAGNDDSVKTIENYNNSGKTVLEVTPKNQNSENPLSPNLQFKVDNWVESGKYPVKYTLVWNEDERVVGINPNNDYDGTNATITNTSSFTYELPVINNSATRLMTQVTDQPTDSSTYSTGAYNLAPNDEVKYRLSLTNSSNAATRNNVVISTLPRVSDKNIVLNSKDRGSQFDVHMTAAATTPEGWTAYYSTTPVSGTAVELERTITLTADQITDWSTVTAVKFVSNQDVSLKAGSTAAFYIPAKASSTATNNQVAVLSSATRTDGQDTFNETNPARISIKIEDVKKGAVKVAYENKDNVSIKDTVTAIESRAYKKGYDVDTKEYKPDTLIGKDGKEYYFVKVKDSSPRPTGTIDSPEVTVTYVYDLLYDETEESHTVTRTIKYIDAAEKTKQVADPVTQTATIKRVNKVNRKTKEKIEGTWSAANWDEKTSPSVENYNAPNREKVGIVPITSTTEDVTEIIEYIQAVDTKTVATKQTVTYEGAGEKTPAPNEQTNYTFTGKTNKVTNVTTWNEETHTYGFVTTPKVEGYYADKAQAGGKEVTPTNPEASDKVVYKPLGKVILVDEGGNEIPNTPKPTYKNNPNDPTVGGETPIPEIPDGYEIKPNQDVPGFNSERKVVTPPKPGEDTRIVLVAKQGDITKATKQTVTYEGAGEKTPAPNEQTNYTFTGKTNKVTNVTTWNEETHTYGFVTTPKVEGYYADKAQAGGKEVTPTNPEASDKVVYKPLGKVILVDEGGNEIPNTPKPTYKNNPNDPTVGGETPIPEIPDGYEIKPNQDVPGFNPEGKVVTPSKPGEDTRIVLVKVNQKVTVTYIVEGTSTVLHTDNLEGKSGEPINYSTTAKLTELKQSGYNLVSDGFTTATDKNYDNNPKVDQSFLVTVAKTIPVTPTDPKNPNEDPQNPKPGDPIDPKNPNGPTWTKEALDKLNNIKSVTRTITYIKDGTTEEVSPTEAPKVTNKVSFTRTVVVNPKDGSVVGYDTTGDGIADVPATDTTSGWTASGTAKFAEVKSPVVKGYVVKPNQDTQGDLVEADGSKVKASTTDLTVDSPNQDLKVRYVVVGKIVPKIPEGETPLTPASETPYGNDPQDPGKVVTPDPTKPTDPQDPNSPKVPVVPHVPGYTPKDPDGNPLKPVDPKDPSKGYVPPTPKTPTENTEIKYEKDTQKAVTKFKDPSENPIPGVTNIEETGKSGEPLTKATEVTTEIAKLIAKGYDLVSNNYGKDNNGNFDKDSGKDQEYTVVLTPHVESIKPFDPTNPNDPNTPKPGQPIDPKNPNGPKWTEKLIKELNTTKHVTRTIIYVEDGTNKEVANKVTEKITFTREAEINVVTGDIEYSQWRSNFDIFGAFKSPDIKGYVLKDSAQRVVESKGVTETTPDETIKVVYVPVGKLVPKVPEGVTPPTPVTDTPYENVPGEPGKVVPPSPTKPQDPQDPNSPKVPVIPHIPGTTPQVPTDPTKPVDPNTNPLVPLKPVDPKDPSKGYEVPPVPTDPTANTPVNYVKDGQKAITNFVDNNGKVVSDPVVDEGDSGTKFTKSGEVESKIKELVKKGYVVTSNDYPSADTDRVFDNDKDKDQIFNVKVTPLIVPTDPNSPDKPQVPTDPTKPVGPNNPLKPVTPSTPEPGKPVFPEDPNSPVWPESVKDLVTETTATRTITYVDQNGKEVAATHTETIKFKRSAKVNLVTGEIIYGNWTVVGDDTILDGNKLPKVDGYIARRGDIDASQEDIKATAGMNITQTVVYDKLGSWVPKVPEGATPVPPITYPNDPTDPTKPGTDKPIVPHVPGFIPVDPNGNPLKPVDPNDPTKGYEVPDVPADPTQDTPIKYVPVIPEKPTPTPVVPVQPEGPNEQSESNTPKYADGQNELPNTGTKDHADLATLGLLGALSGFGLVARKKREE